MVILKFNKKGVVQNKNSGITLIALVISIIVLLILAGISISMLSGNNGILQRATDAKTETEKGKVYEQISLATASGEMDYYSNGTNRLTAYKNALLNGVDGIDRDNLIDNGSNLITGTVTTKSGKQYDFSVLVPVTNVTVSEHNNTEHPLASTVLKVNPEGSTPVDKSPYVNYTYKEGEQVKTILCRVLYDADSEYGIQIVAENPVEKINLGYSDNQVPEEYTTDFEKCKWSYNNVVASLNNKSKEYLSGNNIAETARSIGSNPANPDYPDNEEPALMWTSYHEWMTTYHWNGVFKATDTNYTEDESQLTLLNLSKITDDGAIIKWYWMASRKITGETNFEYCYIHFMNGLGNISQRQILTLNGTNGSTTPYSSDGGLRPVFILKSGVKIKDGDGSKDNPYILEL